MPLLSGMMRSAAIYGSTDTLSARLAGRQGGRWARQTVGAAFPQRPAVASPAAVDPVRRLEALSDLHRRGVLTDAEFEALRGRLRL